MDGIRFVNIGTSAKHDVLGGYYFSELGRFVGFIRLVEPELASRQAALHLGDYLCCMKTGCAFQVVGKLTPSLTCLAA